MIQLVKTTEDDLKTLFIFQLDEEANQMAAFTPKDPQDEKAYFEKWTKIINNPAINMQTIWINNKIVGSVIHFDIMKETNVSYWIKKSFWGQGIATQALKGLIQNSSKRPLFARVAFDNLGSQRVLEKCGFQSIGKENGFANARNQEIEEFIYKFE